MKKDFLELIVDFEFFNEEVELYTSKQGSDGDVWEPFDGNWLD